MILSYVLRSYFMFYDPILCSMILSFVLWSYLMFYDPILFTMILFYVLWSYPMFYDPILCSMILSYVLWSYLMFYDPILCYSIQDICKIYGSFKFWCSGWIRKPWSKEAHEDLFKYHSRLWKPVSSIFFLEQIFIYTWLILNLIWHNFVADFKLIYNLGGRFYAFRLCLSLWQIFCASIAFVTDFICQSITGGICYDII